jgi:hypothetical protein
MTLALYDSTNIVRTDIVVNQPIQHGWHRTIFMIHFDDGKSLGVDVDIHEDGREHITMSMCK